MRKFDFVLIGLGNPGREYEGTRHNIGFDILLSLSRELDFPKFRMEGNVLVSDKVLPVGKVLLALPQTFMNVSGEVFENLKKRYDFSLSSLLVVCDDLNLPLGEIRYRTSGSSGGHNGLKSIEEHLGTKDYSRLKFGIGRSDEDVADFVLGHWFDEEKLVLSARVRDAVASLIFWIEHQSKRDLMNSIFNKTKE